MGLVRPWVVGIEIVVKEYMLILDRKNIYTQNRQMYRQTTYRKAIAWNLGERGVFMEGRLAWRRNSE